jgi:hypothetical protein
MSLYLTHYSEHEIPNLNIDDSLQVKSLSLIFNHIMENSSKQTHVEKLAQAYEFILSLM